MSPSITAPRQSGARAASAIPRSRRPSPVTAMSRATLYGSAARKMGAHGPRLPTTLIHWGSLSLFFVLCDAHLFDRPVELTDQTHPPPPVPAPVAAVRSTRPETHHAAMLTSEPAQHPAAAKSVSLPQEKGRVFRFRESRLPHSLPLTKARPVARPPGRPVARTPWNIRLRVCRCPRSFPNGALSRRERG